MSESIDLPKSFDQVYGVGPGGQLDQEILVYMKSQGWPERVQVKLSLKHRTGRILLHIFLGGFTSWRPYGTNRKEIFGGISEEIVQSERNCSI